MPIQFYAGPGFSRGIVDEIVSDRQTAAELLLAERGYGTSEGAQHPQ